jgi:GNAT superfamily N-acetyltransferase
MSLQAQSDVTPQVFVFEPGEAASFAEVSEGVHQLFRTSYHAYHYLNEVLEPSRARFIALLHRNVIGFGTVKIVGETGVLSNLVVCRNHRGHGVGSAIEDERAAYCRRLRVAQYSSCVTVGVQSQRLKLRNGLVPINVKYGYRRGVFSPSEVSSAVTFVSGDVPRRPPQETCVLAGTADRLRIVAATVEGMIGSLPCIEAAKPDRYVDVLATQPVAEWLNRHQDKFAFHGADFLAATNESGALFQYINQAYSDGVHEPLDLCQPARDIVGSGRAWLSVAEQLPLWHRQAI